MYEQKGHMYINLSECSCLSHLSIKSWGLILINHDLQMCFPYLFSEQNGLSLKEVFQTKIFVFVFSFTIRKKKTEGGHFLFAK